MQSCKHSLENKHFIFHELFVLLCYSIPNRYSKNSFIKRDSSFLMIQ